MTKQLFISILLLRTLFSQAQPDTDDLYDDIKRRFGLNDYIGCVEACDRMLAVKPKSGDAFYYKAYSKLILGDCLGAEQDIKFANTNNDDVSPDRNLLFMLSEEKKIKYLQHYFYKNEKIYPELGYRPKYTRKDSLRGALRPERTCFDVGYYDLDITIRPRKKTIQGKVGISFKVVNSTSCIQIDLFERFKIDSIKWNNQVLSYRREFDALFISFPKTLDVGSLQTITIKYSGKPQVAVNPPWEGGFVWKDDDKGNFWSGVACERLGASSWWPNKDHPSDEPDSARLAFTVPDGYDLISNGRFVTKTPAEKGYTKHIWKVSNPINNYNITFYLGKFSHFGDTMKGVSAKYPLDYYVFPYHLDDVMTYFNQVKEVLSSYENHFGSFPFANDKFCLVESPYEGMEHQGAIAFGSDFSRKDRDQVYLNKKYDYIIVHETAHEWWGNSVTAGDMSDIWLQEGFATYAELLFLEDKYGHETYLKELKRKEQDIYNTWPLVQNYDVNENAFASNDCYNKGAAVLHNLRCCINNDSLFFKLIKDFATRNAKKVVRTSDFIQMTNNYTGKDYTSFFKKFLFDKNLPILNYSYRRDGKDIILKYRWDSVEKDFTMPICINTVAKSYRLEPTTSDQEIVLKYATTIRFLTNWIEPDNVKPNSYTYFWTRCEKSE